jgi:hypothetical protein
VRSDKRLLTVELQHPIAEADWPEIADYLRWLANEIEAGEYRSFDVHHMLEPARLL